MAARPINIRFQHQIAKGDASDNTCTVFRRLFINRSPQRTTLNIRQFLVSVNPNAVQMLSQIDDQTAF